MKRRFILILLSLVLVLGLATTALADYGLVLDDSQLLTMDEVAQLEAQYAAIRDEKGFTPYLLTVDSFQGMSADGFAELMYNDILECEYDGMLLLVSLEEGEWYIYVKGVCDKTLTDNQIDAIGEAVVEHLRDGDYYEAFETYGERCVAEMSPTGILAQELNPTRIILSLLLGLIVAFIVLTVMKSGMKTVKPNNTANYYARPGSMKVNISRDIFLYSNVTRVRKQSSSSGGGGGGSSSRGSGGGRGRGGSI